MVKQPLTVAQTLSWAISYVKNNPDLSVDQAGVNHLLAAVLAVDEVGLLQRLREPMPPAAATKFEQLVKRYAAGEPVQYLIGTAPFFGYQFKVTPAVLIPRVETADLVEWVLADNDPQEKLTVLDLGCGSGAIGISLAKNSSWHVNVSDISEKALAVCRTNQQRLGVALPTYHSDVFAAIDNRFDVVVANPPYISRKEIPQMDASVTNYEPHLALFAANDGLAVYQQIAAQINRHINPGGKLYLEIGWQQAEAVQALFRTVPHVQAVSVKRDLSDHARMVRVTFK